MPVQPHWGLGLRHMNYVGTQAFIPLYRLSLHLHHVYKPLYQLVIVALKTTPKVGGL